VETAVSWSVGELAARSGVPATTLRFYDSIGLLVPARLPNGHRRYGPDALEQLHLVRLCQSLGCSLDEVALLLSAGGAARRRGLAARKLVDVDAALVRLHAVRAVLQHLAGCEHTSPENRSCRADVRAALRGLSLTDSAGGT
jgi:DNA-binding transcriptional MerR regulator